MRKLITPLLLSVCLFSSLFASCAKQEEGKVLWIASWDEYIDEGGADSYIEGSLPLYRDFENWYYQQTGEKITVEYVSLQDNETMYNKIKMGDTYDLLCPSEYMIMKLAEEGKIQKFPQTFFDESVPTNYYAQNVSPFIKERFASDNLKLSNGDKLAEYTAGYMWGTTGFVFNPQTVAREDVKSWNVFKSEKYNRKITAKDNVRDSYFAGLGMYYEQELLSLKARLDNGEINLSTYQIELARRMNDTSPQTIKSVQTLMEKMRGNLYGLETDEGKLDIITGRFDVSYQWSGDAVYVLDMAEDTEITAIPKQLEYCIPDASSNLWFDGWVLMEGSKMTKEALAFINYVSMPENVIRNMYYIGYTSCIAGDEVFSYIEETYGAEEDGESADYDLSYFFGENHVLSASADQVYKQRQLFAQYPTEDVLDRLVVMKYFDKKANERVNRMWNNIK